MLKEVLHYSNIASANRIIDGTVGDGGYIKEFLKASDTVVILGTDLDQVSLGKLRDEFASGNLSQRVKLVHSNFRNIKSVAEENQFVPVSAVILDLGFSSTQLDDPTRGLSFQSAGPLDMRFDSTQKKTAAEIINSYPPHQLAEVFRDYGEEKLASKIAADIIKDRAIHPFRTTVELFETIKRALPKPVVHKASDYARRVFQALRIETNDELENLRRVLPDVLEILEPGGRMLVISFHSLEDRIVKEFMVTQARGCVCPPDFPYCVCGKNPNLKILTKKPIVAAASEIAENSRSKPAKMRVAEKINLKK